MKQLANGIAAWLLIATASCYGEGASEPPALLPTGNLACRITVAARAFEQHKSEDQTRLAALPIITGIYFTRIGGICRYELEWAGGRKTEAWRDDTSGLVASKHPRSGRIIVSEQTPPVPILANLGAGAISWIRSADFVKATNLQGRSVLHYQRIMELPDSGETTYQGWIDRETRLPFALDDGDALYQFTYEAPPTAAPIMPEEFRAALQRYRTATTPPKRL